MLLGASNNLLNVSFPAVCDTYRSKGIMDPICSTLGQGQETSWKSGATRATQWLQGMAAECHQGRGSVLHTVGASAALG